MKRWQLHGRSHAWRPRNERDWRWGGQRTLRSPPRLSLPILCWRECRLIWGCWAGRAWRCCGGMGRYWLRRRGIPWKATRPRAPCRGGEARSSGEWGAGGVFGVRVMCAGEGAGGVGDVGGPALTFEPSPCVHLCCQYKLSHSSTPLTALSPSRLPQSLPRSLATPPELPSSTPRLLCCQQRRSQRG